VTTDLLLRPFKAGPGHKFSEKECADYETAIGTFKSLAGTDYLEGTKLVERIYGFVDDLCEEHEINDQTYCHVGCSHCCYQLVCCTTPEMQIIVRHVDKLPRQKNRQIKRQAMNKARKFYKRYKGQIEPGKVWQTVNNPLTRAHRGVPCIYLDSFRHRCLIYPARPINCRTARTATQCGYNRHPKTVKFYFDQIAVDIITKEEKKLRGTMYVVPLVAWPLTPEFFGLEHE